MTTLAAAVLATCGIISNTSGSDPAKTSVQTASGTAKKPSLDGFHW